jgi:hypothetical protein
VPNARQRPSTAAAVLLHHRVRVLSRLAAVTVGCALLILGLSVPALAHDQSAGVAGCGDLHNYLCGYGQVRDSHQIIDACDTYKDGQGLYVKYTLMGGDEGKVGDANGSAAGCGIRRVGSATYPIVRFNVCSDVAVYPDKCTGWIWA